MENNGLKIFRIGKKNIGEYHPNEKSFVKEVMKSKHFFRVLHAWGIDNDVLNQLPIDTRIFILDKEEKKIYSTMKGKYDLFGQYYHFKGPKIDHRTQKFLTLEHFEVSDAKTAPERILSEEQQFALL
jgi:5'(3')-deoxyribonucleotidase